MSDSPTPETSSEAIPNSGSKTRQLLGMKGAAPGETSIWKIRLQLMKPITWIPLIWGVVCGAASSGGYSWTLEDILKAAACMLLSGPLMAGYTQTLNDFYDRDLDAINEPYRPIPSGAISIPQVVSQILILLGAGIGLAYILDIWAGHEFPMVTVLCIGGAFVSYIYSAPPLKLKKNGWLGNYALGASYIALPWWAGHALFGELNPTIVVLTLFYSLAGLGIAIVNDFKSVEGDRQLGLQSLPVMFGVTTAAWICVLMIDIFQAGVALYLISIQQNLYATILLLLVIPQITFQDMYFLRNPLENDVKYQASAQPFLVLGMLVVGLALGHAV
ncbi:MULTISPECIES: chlorophyll synthase ChlG [Arthrospira]|jgi:chlorophyll synthase|uniref:Chlorophyll synthase n=1 Tax=Limnospira platensis NIES-46 TaxID=1236695 RepID=A0A5M3TAD9_LIMPL|nr:MULTISPECIES: chlorophyll synthase ChlG [Arthrospira]KDR55879.1 chitin-binding protein [Arthrospira platensis str. Paraca]MBD2670862.1 chlorophyll synthase ChlG [Arthrospira platensis FACHB-439]MBD2711573.1 chlorophyll synthase ChlG [Arthrospira platensis FACHB-835]MDF2210079.1 chlorophyll synthase ChlG [Arthrospira platensis NCB002]MDT9184052.1 chlorophyll synthase ChlG [Limnospira sp. PMC 289.06]MDT9296270.1 chlorophyll synthase ChlG [Arthrospira platensis PCC 7345]MDT9311799.1 chloroph